MAKASYKILSFSTTMRSAERMASFLKLLTPFENQILSHELIMQIVAELIKNKLYVPVYANKAFKQSEENFSDKQVKIIIENSPQNHKEAGFDKGWDSRFDTWYKLMMEFGFCFYAMNKPLIISQAGHLLIDAFNENPSNDEKIANIFLNCMMKYQSKNPFRKVLNDNKPLILLLQTMKLLKSKTKDSKIHKLELPFLLCYPDDNALNLADFILAFRKEYPSFNYSGDIIYEKCLELLNSKNTLRFKKVQILRESIDEYIRKMRITGIISLRANGRFLDFNSFEMPKIEYILKNYKSKTRHFKDKISFFNYMGEINTQIFNLNSSEKSDTKESLKLQSLENFAKNYTREQIFTELKILNNKKLSSKDELFKFIPEPLRLEFLSAISLKQNCVNLKVLPNYIIDDEGLPKSHAGANLADIICLDKKNKSIIELSLISSKAQLSLELIPITRHLKQSKADFAFFVAPNIHEDAKIYTEFIKYKEKLDITNLSILDFIELLSSCFDKKLPLKRV
ncbi:AlwI family type II restriction endonuclease [Campylobacter sp. MIT 99-7217]|uniref:AlwI family type II restriction endonuclease n=1 Tax=Campylobacter sp. MIT 99-7217 TaxID=535091 RepID=UPI0011576FD7|nr:AlwI family type II restriction endonuclease [Campylobacter sp. MIT 99-7217]TQR30600.1 AlwI family type II restriction endonuclease [Campylobacter sp. MIT 99-7217]